MKNFPTTDIILKNILFYTYFSHLYHSSRMFRDFSNTKIKKKTFEFLSIIKRNNTDNNLSIWNFFVTQSLFPSQLSR